MIHVKKGNICCKNRSKASAPGKAPGPGVAQGDLHVQGICRHRAICKYKARSARSDMGTHHRCGVGAYRHIRQGSL